MNKIQKLTIKENFKPEIHNVLVTPEHIVATNTYALIEYKNKITGAGGFKKGVYPVELFSKEIVSFGSDTIVYKDNTRADFVAMPGLEFPDYMQVMPKDGTKFETEINISVENMLAILEAFKEQKIPKFTLKIQENQKLPLLLEATDVRAILMPINS